MMFRKTSLYKSLIICVGERKFHVYFALGSESSGDDSSTYGIFVPGSESTWERKFHNSVLWRTLGTGKKRMSGCADVAMGNAVIKL